METSTIQIPSSHCNYQIIKKRISLENDLDGNKVNERKETKIDLYLVTTLKMIPKIFHAIWFARRSLTLYFGSLLSKGMKKKKSSLV